MRFSINILAVVLSVSATVSGYGKIHPERDANEPSSIACILNGIGISTDTQNSQHRQGEFETFFCKDLDGKVAASNNFCESANGNVLASPGVSCAVLQ